MHQNKVPHIMQFLRPRVAKASYIFESQLIILIQQSHHSFILWIFLHSLCFFALVAFIFSYLFFSFYCISQKQLPLKKGIPTRRNRLDQVHFFQNDRRFIEEMRKFSFFCVFWITLDYLYIYTRLNIYWATNSRPWTSST